MVSPCRLVFSMALSRHYVMILFVYGRQVRSINEMACSSRTPTQPKLTLAPMIDLLYLGIVIDGGFQEVWNVHVLKY